MPDLTDIAEDLRETRFLKDLLEVFVERGLGTLPGRETTITLVELLLKYHPVWKENAPEDYELARLLRTSPRKIRNIRDDLAYRDPKSSDEWCKKELAQILSDAERVQDGSYVTFEIDNGLVRDYARKLVRQNFGVFEAGMNSSVVKISGKTFAALAISVLPEDERDKLLAAIPDEEKSEVQSSQKQKTPIRLFIDSFAMKAGEQAGKKSVDLAFGVLTGGLSTIQDAIEQIGEILKD